MSARTLIVIFAISVISTHWVHAQSRRNATVPPVLEIEVIDPGVDARGNPAVLLQDTGAGVTVDIPPCVLVHRYYFAGERSFRGPAFPGGPTIVVASHPKTGKRTYVSVQMLPGSPIVSYTSRSIEYDFGDAGITVVFPAVGEPRVRVRSGRKWSDRVNDVLPIEQMRNVRDNLSESSVSATRRLALATQGAVLNAGDMLQPITQPAEHLFRMIPGVVALTDPNTEIQNARRALQHRAEKQRERQEFRDRLSELDTRTIR